MLWPSSGGYRLQSTRMQPENIWKEGGGGRSLLRRQNATDGRPSFLRPRRRESRVAAFDPWERKWSPAPQPDRLASLIDPLTDQRKKERKPAVAVVIIVSCCYVCRWQPMDSVGRNFLKTRLLGGETTSFVDTATCREPERLPWNDFGHTKYRRVLFVIGSISVRLEASSEVFWPISRPVSCPRYPVALVGPVGHRWRCGACSPTYLGGFFLPKWKHQRQVWIPARAGREWRTEHWIESDGLVPFIANSLELSGDCCRNE